MNLGNHKHRPSVYRDLIKASNRLVLQLFIFLMAVVALLVSVTLFRHDGRGWTGFVLAMAAAEVVLGIAAFHLRRELKAGRTGIPFDDEEYIKARQDSDTEFHVSEYKSRRIRHRYLCCQCGYRTNKSFDVCPVCRSGNSITYL